MDRKECLFEEGLEIVNEKDLHAYFVSKSGSGYNLSDDEVEDVIEALNVLTSRIIARAAGHLKYKRESTVILESELSGRWKCKGPITARNRLIDYLLMDSIFWKALAKTGGNTLLQDCRMHMQRILLNAKNGNTHDGVNYLDLNLLYNGVINALIDNDLKTAIKIAKASEKAVWSLMVNPGKD